MTNLNELYKAFAEAVNQNSMETQKTLYKGLQQLLKSTEADVNPEPVMDNVQAPVEPVQAIQLPPAPPVVEDKIEMPAPQNEAFDLHAKVEKNCSNCPFQNSCDLKTQESIKLTDNCNLSKEKNLFMNGGEFEIHVPIYQAGVQEPFKIYKNGIFIGVVHETRENRPFIAKLEWYAGSIVHVSTEVLKPRDGVMYTKLSAVIVGITDFPKQEDVIEQPKPVDYTSVNESTENNSLLDGLEETVLETEETSSSSLLGEMVLPI